MKSRYSLFTLVLPALMFFGFHLFGPTPDVTASFHDDSANQKFHEFNDFSFFNDHKHDATFFHGNFFHGTKRDFNHQFFHGVAANGRNRTWEKAQSWDDQAREDMRARIAHKGPGWTPHTDSFGKQSNWLPGWELRWWSFSSKEGRSVWVYHARSKANGQRFTSFADSVNGKLQEWKPAR